MVSEIEDVAGKNAIITGGASGLGLAMAKSFASAGINVAITDIEERALAEALKGFEDSSTRVIGIKADVTNRDDMARAAQQAIDSLGNIHILCNNAGVALSKPIAKMTYKDWDWVIGVDLMGVINGIQSVLPHMIEHSEGGHVVNTSSMAGYYGMLGNGAYAAAKFAVVGISETMRLDLRRKGINVSVLSPGVVDTGIFQSERNRQDEFGGELDSGFKSPATVAALKAMKSLHPSVIGDMVLHAIRNEIFYIFSHREFQPGIDARHKEITEAFDLWEEFLEGSAT